MNKLSGASYSAIHDAICNQLDYLVGGEQYELLLQALNELNAIYYGEEVTIEDVKYYMTPED